ncbi:MAG: hypothetical protein GY694_18685, partial [Gammaproteobacteria bacterium]|nr:hypothetical protein [Gammaproteobacteria bacterium]
MAESQSDEGLSEKDLNAEASARMRGGKVSHITRRMKILNRSTLMADNESVEEVKENLAKFEQ